MSRTDSGNPYAQQQRYGLNLPNAENVRRSELTCFFKNSDSSRFIYPKTSRQWTLRPQNVVCMNHISTCRDYKVSSSKEKTSRRTLARQRTYISTCRRRHLPLPRDHSKLLHSVRNTGHAVRSFQLDRLIVRQLVVNTDNYIFLHALQ